MELKMTSPSVTVCYIRDVFLNRQKIYGVITVHFYFSEWWTVSTNFHIDYLSSSHTVCTAHPVFGCYLVKSSERERERVFCLAHDVLWKVGIFRRIIKDFFFKFPSSFRGKSPGS
jgi:hypothetical protein